jgi:chemotaxis protein MotB
MVNEQPIIIIRKKGGHSAHHGGAWKVAYADFVTAMMALFIVLWLLSSTSKQTQEDIAGYFNDPHGTATKKGSEGKPTSKPQDKQHSDMAALKEQLLRAIQDVELLNKLNKQIEVTVTDEGLRIDLIENKAGTFFEVGSAQPTPALQTILKVLSGELKRLPNNISVEGHTDAQPYANKAGYGNWELSSDRANEARREMQTDGLRSDQVSQVRGFADQQLHIPERPYDPANRRVSVVVQNSRIKFNSGKSSEVLAATEPNAAQSEGKRKSEPVLQATVDAKPTPAKPTPMIFAHISEKPGTVLLQRARKIFGR